MNKYKIEVSERLSKIIEIQAGTDFKAMEKVKKMYRNDEIILNRDNFENVDYEIIEVQEIRFNEYETVCILNKDTKLQDIDRIIKFMKENFEIRIAEYIGIKKLAYKIGDNTEGYYLRIEMTGTKESSIKLEEYYKQNDNVLKFITVKCE